MAQECSVEDCGNTAVKRSWCQTHYTRWHRHGNPTYTKIEMHGLTKDPLYAIWISMKNRCRNPKEKYYYLYGGRGIKVCSRWYDSFTAFKSDMGPRPDNHTLERRDNNANYTPNNCYWATSKEQAHNRRTNRFMTIQNQTKPFVEWCRDFNIGEMTVRGRIKRGLSFQEALTLPIRKRG